MTTLIAPSILAADFSRIGAEVLALDQAGADWIHVDVMDGHFVPNITIGPLVVAAVRPYTEKPIDVHLMIDPVDAYLEAFATAGADSITVHAEACTHLDRTLDAIHVLGKRAGVAINPATPPELIRYVLDRLDLVLVMSVNPGFGGQSFIDATLSKITAVKTMIADRPIVIEVDGGIGAANASSVTRAGADILVAGSAVFQGGEYASNIAAIRAAGDAGRAELRLTGG